MVFKKLIFTNSFVTIFLITFCQIKSIEMKELKVLAVSLVPHLDLKVSFSTMCTRWTDGRRSLFILCLTEAWLTVLLASSTMTVPWGDTHAVADRRVHLSSFALSFCLFFGRTLPLSVSPSSCHVAGSWLHHHGNIVHATGAEKRGLSLSYTL